MKDRGVVVVFSNAEVATRHGCVEDERRGIKAERGEILGAARAFRCSYLEDAMRLVLATDPVRSVAKCEKHVEFEEVLDSGATITTAACVCNRCKAEGRGVYSDNINASLVQAGWVCMKMVRTGETQESEGYRESCCYVARALGTFHWSNRKRFHPASILISQCLLIPPANVAAASHKTRRSTSHV